jgi:hypothetical protein
MLKTQKDFREATKLKAIWNKIIKLNDLTLATVQWHDKPWKHIKDGEDFDTIADRQYEPIAEFRTQAELYQYLKENNLY